MLLRERRTKTSCAVTLLRTHMTGLLLGGPAHVFWALTGKRLPLSPCISSQSGEHAVHDVNMYGCEGEEVRKGK